MNNQKIQHHIFIYGQSGKGTSTFFNSQPLTPEEENLKQVKLEARNMELKKKREIEEQQLQAVKDAYWKKALEIDPNLYEFCSIYDSLVEYLNIDEPTDEQLKIVFNMLDRHTIGQGISWGFSDTEVRDNIYVFIKDNVSKIQEKLN